MDRSQLLNDPEQALRLALEGHQTGIWTAIPGIVVHDSVDLETLTCDVQPTIQAIVEDQNGNKSWTNLPVLLNVPIVFPSAGGFSITFPIAAGDEVLVVFASRCIDAWWQSGGVQQAMENRINDLSDGFCIPGVRSVPNVPSDISATNLQIRKDDGTAFIEMEPSGNVTMTSPTVTINGDMQVNGAIVASGEITGDGIPLAVHYHEVVGVQTGASTVPTSPPSP